MKCVRLLFCFASLVAVVVSQNQPENANVPRGWRVVKFRGACQYAVPYDWNTQGAITFSSKQALSPPWHAVEIFGVADKVSDWQFFKARLKEARPNWKVVEDSEIRIVLMGPSSEAAAHYIVRRYVANAEPKFYCGVDILVPDAVDVPSQKATVDKIVSTVGQRTP